MPTLIVDFHCMCLFVPDGDRVHVLLPAMHGDGGETGEVPPCPPDGAPPGQDASEHTQASHQEHGPDTHSHRPERHLARVRNSGFRDPKLGKPIENLILKVENGRGPANTDLNGGPKRQPRLPDLTEVSGRYVPRKLVEGPLPGDLIARITLGAGAVMSRHSDPYSWRWCGEDNVQLANTVTWVVPNSPDALVWEGSQNHQRPFQSLRNDLAESANDLYRISIHHETKKTLCGGEIDLAEMQHHFAQFYRLLGMDPPPTAADCPELFPEFGGKRKDKDLGASVLCRAAMAQVTA